MNTRIAKVQAHKHSVLILRVGGIGTTVRQILQSSTTSDRAKELAVHIEELAALLKEALKERIDA